MASITGTSSNESVESCGKQTREAIFRLQTLQRHDIYKFRNNTDIDIYLLLFVFILDGFDIDAMYQFACVHDANALSFRTHYTPFASTRARCI